MSFTPSLRPIQKPWFSQFTLTRTIIHNSGSTAKVGEPGVPVQRPPGQPSVDPPTDVALKGPSGPLGLINAP